MFLAIVKLLLGGANEEQRFIDHLLNSYHLMTPTQEQPEISKWGITSNSKKLDEKLIGENTLRPIAFLQKGVEVARAVAFIDVGDWVGTGFMINSNLLVTNHHVLPNLAVASDAVFRFNYQLTFDGREETVQAYQSRKPGIFHTNALLDYSIVELEGSPGDDWASIQVSRHAPKNGDRLNIIQHPSGLPKKISLQNNFVQYVDSTLVQYLTSTLPGSSGSPVLDDDWRLVAVHHAGGTLVEPSSGRSYFRNEGILARAIFDDLPQTLRIPIP